MTVFRFYAPSTAIIDPDAILNEVELVDVSKKRLVGSVEEIGFLQIYGRFFLFLDA